MHPEKDWTPAASEGLFSRMTTQERVTQALHAAIDEVNLQLPVDGQIETADSTLLTGEGGALDSLALMNLIVQVEEKLEEADIGVSLSDDDDLLESAGTEAGPIRSIGTLIAYIAKKAE